MTVTTVQVLAAIAEFLRVTGLLALVVIEGWIIYKLYSSKEALYDRLIESKEQDSDRATTMTERVVKALTKSTSVAERIAQRKYAGLLTPDAGVEEDEDDAEFEDDVNVDS